MYKNQHLILQLFYGLSVLALSQLMFGCKRENKEEQLAPLVPELVKRNIIIDKSIKYQTIDGFGFFGANDVWWASQNLWNDAWGDKVIILS
jgi:hypothetical protein